MARAIRPALIGLMLSGALLASPAAGEMTIERRHVDEAGVEFVYRPGEPVQVTASDPTPSTWFQWPDAVMSADPGGYRLPAHQQRILLPAGRDYRLEFETGPARHEGGVVYPMVPEPAGRAAETGSAGTGHQAGFDGPLPEAAVTARVEEFRGRDVLVLSLSPLAYNPAELSATLFESIRVRVRFVPGGPVGHRRTGRADNDPAVWSNLVLNPESAAGFDAGLAPLAAAAAGARPSVYFDDAPDWAKVGVKVNGLYRITAASLAAAGFNPAAIDPATFRVFGDAGLPLSETTPESLVPEWGEPGGFRELAIFVHESGTPNRQFDDADTLLFYGLSVDNFGNWFDPSAGADWIENEHSDTNIYWLTWSGSFPESPRRWEAVPEVLGGLAVTTVPERRHVEENSPALYDPVPYEEGIRWEKWWWQRIDASGSSFFWDTAFPDIDTSKPVSLFIRWWGANTPAFSVVEPTQRHFLRVSVNDSPETAAIWGGVRNGITRYDMTLTGFTPRPTTRVVATVTRYPDAGNRVDQILLGWFEFSYWKTLSLAAGELWFEGWSEVGPNPVRYRISGAVPGARVLDVTEPWSVRALPATYSTDGSNGVLTINTGDPTGRRYAAFNPAALRAPASIVRDQRPARWLRDDEPGADYILIVADELAAAAEPLAEWRRTHLRGITEDAPVGVPARSARVALVRVSDIYDEFSGGRVDATAIRNFIQYAWNHWGRAEATLPPPLYVCLVGDSNRDTRDREGTGVKNLVPTWEGGYDVSSADEGSPAYASDDFFGRLGGPRDRMTDLAIGRLPLSDPDNAAEVIERKVIGSEEFPGFNPNRNRAIYVADDVCQAGNPDAGLFTAHIYQTEQVALVAPRVLDQRKVYLYDYGGPNCRILVKPAAKRDLVAAINEGGWVVNYSGHGGDQQLADEKVLEVTDVPSLVNNEALPILIAASCSVGKFDRAGSEGLAEALIKWHDGGCIGTMAATHFSFPGENLELNRYIFQYLFDRDDNRSRPIGLALLEAKQEQVSGHTCSGNFESCDRQKKYLLLGDPASVLVVPERQIRISSLPDTLERGTIVTVQGEVLRPDSTLDATFDGQVELLVQDQPETRHALATENSLPPGTPYLIPGATIFNGVAPVTDGRFTATFVVPVSLRGGAAGRVRAYAASIALDAVGAVDPVAIGGLSTSAPTDTTPPAITLSLPEGAAEAGGRMEALIEDVSGINLTRLFEFRSVLFTLLDSEGNESYRLDVTPEFQYDSGSYSRGRATFRLPNLPSGPYTARVTATDNFNNRGEGRLDISLGGGSSGGRLSNVYAIPNPFETTTDLTFELSRAASQVRVQLFSVAGRKVREWSQPGASGENRLTWDGTDGRGDPVANGVYLLRVLVRESGGKEIDVVEPIVRLRR